MSEMDPVEQISDALSRLRWRGGPVHRGGSERWGRDIDRAGHGHAGGHELRRGAHRRGTGGPALGRLLWALASTDESLSVGDVAQLVDVDQPRASRLVAQGVEFGLLRREADAADARRTRIVLTEQGDAMVRRMRGERGAAVREALTDFSDAEREQLAGLLWRLAEAWPHSAKGGPGRRRR